MIGKCCDLIGSANIPALSTECWQLVTRPSSLDGLARGTSTKIARRPNHCESETDPYRRAVFLGFTAKDNQLNTKDAATGRTTATHPCHARAPRQIYSAAPIIITARGVCERHDFLEYPMEKFLPNICWYRQTAKLSSFTLFISIGRLSAGKSDFS